jgi:putative spermidine/putrescine transport system permease protein
MQNVIKSKTPATSGGFGSFRKATSFLPLLPFLALISAFLFWPIIAIVNASLHNNAHKFSFDVYRLLFSSAYIHSFALSFELAAASAIIAVSCGAILTFAIQRSGGTIKSLTSSAAGVLANTGGVPLAFMFIAAIGSDGMITKFLLFFHIDIYATNFDLFSFWGINIVYAYFQIPLMVIVFTPAVEKIRVEWSEANSALGGSNWQYLRYILFPNLLPSLLSALLLLFSSGFSAFATIRAMTVGNLPVVPLVIGSLVDGNVQAGQQNLGDALAVGMVAVSAVVMIGYFSILKFMRRDR